MLQGSLVKFGLLLFLLAVICGYSLPPSGSVNTNSPDQSTDKIRGNSEVVVSSVSSEKESKKEQIEQQRKKEQVEQEKLSKENIELKQENIELKQQKQQLDKTISDLEQKNLEQKNLEQKNEKNVIMAIFFSLILVSFLIGYYNFFPFSRRRRKGSEISLNTVKSQPSKSSSHPQNPSSFPPQKPTRVQSKSRSQNSEPSKTENHPLPNIGRKPSDDGSIQPVGSRSVGYSPSRDTDSRNYSGRQISPDNNIVNLYNTNPDSLDSYYTITKVSENQTSIEARRLGKPVRPVFEKSRSGNYWVLTSPNGNEIYLVPKGQIKFNEYTRATAKSLFNFDDYLAEQSNAVILERPAKVIVQGNSWELVEPGAISFQQLKFI